MGGKYGIHGTNQPSSIGFNASAGCIRMRNKDIEELYNIVEYNTRVNIVNGQYGPFAYGFRKLSPGGDRGADVLEVQKRLKLLGYYDGALDGIYGEGMKSSLIQYLKDNNMPLTDTIDFNIYTKLGDNTYGVKLHMVNILSIGYKYMAKKKNSNN